MPRSRCFVSCGTFLFILAGAGACSAQGTWIRYDSYYEPFRAGFAMAYDGARNEVVLHGGFRTYGYSSGYTPSGCTAITTPDTQYFETLKFDADGWALVYPQPSGVSIPVIESGMAYDAARQQCVLSRGSVTALWDGATWTVLTTPSMGALRGALAYDSLRSRVLLHGHGQTWSWNGSAWTQIVTAAAPPSRERHVMAYDQARDRLVLHGGVALPITYPTVTLGDTWEFDGTNWMQVAATGSVPARCDAAIAYHAARQRIVMCGGRIFDDSSTYADVWEFGGTAWSPLPPLPDARAQHGMVYDTARQDLLVFGGTHISYVGTYYPIYLVTCSSRYVDMARPLLRWHATDPNGSGQANSFRARLDVHGSPFAFGRIRGPLAESHPAGSELQLLWLGEALAPFALAAGPLNPAHTPFGGAGLLDIGTPPAFGDLILILEGYYNPAWRLSNTQPGSLGVGTAALFIPIPPQLAGAQVAFQGLVGDLGSSAYPPTLTAAHTLTFQ